jgi:ATP-dependent DNA ligase
LTALRVFDFCIPTRGTKVPDGPDWLHEIKYNGYRLRLERDGDRVRLITRGGCDWTKRYPWIVESGRKNRHKQFVVDLARRWCSASAARLQCVVLLLCRIRGSAGPGLS